MNRIKLVLSLWSTLAVSLLPAVMSCAKGNPADSNFTQGTVTDIEGNVYKTVKIGNQEWMTENLRTTKYNDDTSIPQVTDSAAWRVLTKPGYCYYNNTTNMDSIKKFGVLYNWYVVDTENPHKIAPDGWHVPTDSEWIVLEKYLIANGYNWDGTTDTTARNKLAKSLAANTDWHVDTTPGAPGNGLASNNRSGLCALPGGYRHDNGSFYSIGRIGKWWSTTGSMAPFAYSCFLFYYYDYLFRVSYFSRSCGFSVILVRDVD